MKMLVTGGGGFLGRYIVEKLLERGHEVRSFSRKTYSELTALGVETVTGDLRNAAAVAEAVRGVDSVFHTAALPGIWGPWKTFHGINTLGTQHVLQACLNQNVKRLVYTSSPSVVYDGKPHLNATEDLPYPQRYLCHYPHSKALAEKSVLAANGTHSLATVALRPHLIWGPRDNHLIPRLIEKARAGRLIQVGDGKNLISMSYVENAADAHLEAHDSLHPAAPHAGQAYFINESAPVHLWEWVNQILQMVKLPPVRRRISAAMAYRLGSIMEGIYGISRLRGEPPMTRFLASQLSQSHTYSIEKARCDFGYAPRISINEGMRRLAETLNGNAS